MNATNTTAEASNIVALKPAPKKRKQMANRFRAVEFDNRGGSKSWRVTGIKRDGSRVRENFAEAKAAEVRRNELEIEWLAGHVETEVQATKLTPVQIRLAEAAFIRLGADDDLPLAVEHWLAHGKALSVVESARIDDAFEKFKSWLATADTLRHRSKKNLRSRANIFVNSVPNTRIADVTPDTIKAFLATRKVSPKTKDNDRRAISAFFSFCIERKWIKMNPCRFKVPMPQPEEPTVLTVAACKELLKQAEAHKKGRLAPYFAVCLFGGLRPFEASRLQWAAVNLKDGEIRLEANQTKTKKSRVPKICKTLKAWLTKYEGKPFYPSNWRRDFEAIQAAAGYGEKNPWPDDVLRHTAVSHYFRECGSYGRTAEQFGNSEAIIKKHYQGKVTSAETKQFYALRPGKAASEG